MNSVFHFSVLQYHHSQALGEVLNIGVLLWFPEQRQAVFRYPSRLSRIKKLYTKFPEKTIRAYFRGISIRANQLSKQPEIFANYEQHPRQLIDNEILIRDSSALQFSDVKTGVVYTSDLTKIADEFYRLYLAFYDDEDPHRGRHDEAYLLTAFKKNLRQRLSGRIDRETLDRPITVKPGSTDLSYQFPFAWQNGTYNLIKPVSFDLKLEQSIHEKATLNFGQFTLLQPYADEHNARFDLLVARPKDRRLYKSYDQAIELIDQQPRVKIVEESELAEYTDAAAKSLT